MKKRQQDSRIWVLPKNNIHQFLEERVAQSNNNRCGNIEEKVTERDLLFRRLRLRTRKETNDSRGNCRSHIGTNDQAKRHVDSDNSRIEGSKDNDRCSGTCLHHRRHDRTNEHKTPNRQVDIVAKRDKLCDYLHTFFHISDTQKKKTKPYEKFTKT